MNKVVDTKALLKGPRSVWKDSFSHIGTSKHGKIVPVYFKEMLPGQNFKPSTGLSIRMNPLISPIFDDIYADIYWFWVPYRIIWNQSKQFFGENDVKAWTQTKKLQMPHGSSSAVDLETSPQTLFDYILGSLNSPSSMKASDDDFNDLPLRAYIEIYNQWFRNQNVIDPVLYNKDFESTSDNDYDLYYEDEPLNACRLHDIAETLLPQPQKGDAVTLGIADFAPLGYLKNDNGGSEGYSPRVYNVTTDEWGSAGSTDIVFGKSFGADNNYFRALGNYDSIASGKDGGTLFSNPAVEEPFSADMVLQGQNFKTNLVADLQNATAVTIQDLYYAECLERFRYLLGIGGSRYQEFLRTMFGVVPNSEILDVPELLHSKRIKLNISQVVSHSEVFDPGDQDKVIPMGDVAGISWTNDKTDNAFNKYCPEHGLIMALMVTRHPTTYAQKIHPFAYKKDLLDIYVPPFANIYDVPFFTKYIFPYLPASSDKTILDDTLGFASPWWDYKHELNKVSGYMNPIYQGSLKTYSLATVFSTKPTLSKEFVEESRQSIMRVTAGDFGFDYMWSFYVEYETAVRMNPDSVPGDIIGKVGI